MPGSISADDNIKVVYSLRLGSNSEGEGGRWYGTLPQGDVPGGPIVYQDKSQADAMAEALGAAVVVERTLSQMISICLEAGWVLWLKQPDGSLSPVPETIGQRGTLPGGPKNTRRKK